MHFSNETSGPPETNPLFLISYSLTTITMLLFLMAESVMLGLREKLSKLSLLEPAALVLSTVCLLDFGRVLFQ